MRRAMAVAGLSLALLSVGGGTALAADPGSTGRAVTPAATRCQDTSPPGWFTNDSIAVAKDSSAIPDAWGSDINWARIACFESSYRVDAANGAYHGLGQMSEQSVSGVGVSWNAYLNGTSTHAKSWYQIQAALKYCKSRYGSPAAGWSHEVKYGYW